MYKLFSTIAMLFVLSMSSNGSPLAQDPAGVAKDKPTLHRLHLRFINANDVLLRLGWERDGSTDDEPQMPPDGFRFSLHTPSLPFPAGVDFIHTDTVDNDLIVLATPAGNDYVEKIAKSLDYTPWEAALQVTFVMASQSEAKTAGIDITGSQIVLPTTNGTLTYAVFNAIPERAIQAYLRNHPAAVTMSSLNVTDKHPATVCLYSILSDMQGGSPLLDNAQLQVQARINGDATVTLSVSGDLVTATRTVPDGEAAVFPCNRTGQANVRSLIMFITPTILGGRTPSPQTSP